jgi:hypothetical protein
VVHNASLVGDGNSQNPYGILVKLSENSEDTFNDPRFSYKADSFKIGNQSKKLWTKEEGLSGVCFGSYGGVDSYVDYLQDSSVNGRVVVFDAEGVEIKDFIAQEVTPFQEKIAGIEKILRKA